MPIYEFKCLDCGTIMERLVFPNNKGETCICRNCGGDRTERIMSITAARTVRRGWNEPVAVPGAGGGSKERDASSAGKWPANEDYIRLKGQQ